MSLRILLFAWLLLATHSEGVIIHVSIPEDQQAFLGLGDPVFRDFDFDQDGKNDLRFVVEGGRFLVGTTNPETQIFISELLGGGFIGATAVPLLYGETVDQYVAIPGEYDRSLSPTRNGFVLSYFNGANVGGVWAGREAYLGFGVMTRPSMQGEFDQFQLGWLRLREFQAFGGFFLEYAYETEVNKPILAGQIPEPDTAPLVFLTGLLLTRRRRRPPP